MLINELTRDAKNNNLNVYSVSVMDESGINECRVNPADLCTNSYSVAKAFTMTAVGMLWDAGKISVEDRITDILDGDFPDKYDPKWNEVTTEHLLTHKVGFGRGGLLDIDVDDISKYPSDDFMKVIASEPLTYTPGTHFVYTDAAFYLLSRIVSKISGERLDDFLRPILFEKLGFRELSWSLCPRGFSMGATGLYLRTSDMVKLGYVYANDGLYGGARIVSAEWCRLVLERGYEFSRHRNTGVYMKGGMYGQMLCFSPKCHVACAWHAYEPEKNVGCLLDEFAKFTDGR